MVQDRIRKGILKFLEKKEAMVVDEDLFPLVAIVNTSTVIDFNISFDVERAKEYKPIPKFKKAWVPKKCILPIDEPLALVAREQKKKQGSSYSAVGDFTRMVHQRNSFTKDFSLGK